MSAASPYIASLLFLFENNLTNLFTLAVLSLHCCSGFSPVVVSRAYSLVAVPRLLTAVASLVAEHRLSGTWASVVSAHGL